MDAELERWKSDGQYFDYLGFDVFYRKEGSGPTLLLIHGYPFNSWDWVRLWDRLTDRFTVIAPDMLGMGFSDKPAKYEYTVHDHADMHEALLSELGLGSAHVLAHDLGDSVGQEMLARHEFGQQAYGALRIESITWLNGGLFNEAYTPRLRQKALSRTPLGDMLSPLQATPGVPALDRTHPQRVVRAGDQTDATDARPVSPDPRVQRRQAGDTQGRQVRQRPLRASESVGPGDAANRHPDAADRRPVDPNSGRHMAQRYLEVIPNPDVVMLDDKIGHWPQIEAPDAVLENFLAHVESVTAQR